MMLNPWIAMTIVMVILTTTIHILGQLKRNHNLNSELVRKILHLVMGSVTLSFPWLFAEVWPVITLSIFASIFISMVKISDLKEWKPVVCAKGRTSIGEICFPIAVGILFMLAEGNKFLYLAPVAILTFADSASALIGVHFGKRKYSTVDGYKSTEGSLTFLIVAFFATLITSMQFTDLNMESVILLSSAVAIIAMLFESVAWNGLDNMSIPIGAYLAINTHMGLPVQTMQERLAFLLIMAACVIRFKKRSTLNGSAVLGVVLYLYFAFILGGFAWVLAPTLLYVSYRFLLPKRFRNLKSFHTIYGVIAVAAAGMIWLLIANKHADPMYIFPYTLTFAAHAAIISIAHMRYNKFDRVRIRVLIFAVLKAWSIMCVPLVLLDPTPYMISLNLFLAPFAIGIPTFLFYSYNSANFESLTKPKRWVKQASFASIGSVLGLIPLLI